MKKLFCFLKPYWLFAAVSPVMMMGEVMGDLMQPKLLTYIIDNGITAGDMGYVVSMGLLMLLIVAIGGFLVFSVPTRRQRRLRERAGTCVSPLIKR